MTLDSATSNIDSSYTSSSPQVISYGDLAAGSNTYDAARLHVGVDNNNGPTVWYNYAAASAMTITGSSNSTNGTYDICPSGWRLPIRSELQTSTGFKNIFNPVGGGAYYTGQLLGPTNGRWWTSTASSAINHYRLTYDGSVLGTDSGGRAFGFYIRCVSR